jgi:D-alanine-D-alanine ligase
VPSNEWYDYQAKYLGGESRIIIPAPIASDLAEQVRELGIRAFKAIDGAGLARVDFLLDRSTGALYLNEANTMPGFTSVSMYAKMWEASGLSYSALLDRLIELALERHTRD